MDEKKYGFSSKWSMNMYVKIFMINFLSIIQSIKNTEYESQKKIIKKPGAVKR